MNKMVANKKDEERNNQKGRWSRASLDEWHKKLSSMTLREIWDEKEQLRKEMEVYPQKTKHSKEKLELLQKVEKRKVEELSGTSGWGC